MNKFQEAFSAPVDMQAEIKTYEENQARERGDVVPEPEADVEDAPAPADSDVPASDVDTQPEDDDDIEASDQRSPHQGGAFKALRAKARKAEDELRSMREEMARQEGERRAWQSYQAQQQAQQPPPAELDPTVDPIGAIESVKRESAELRQYIQQQQVIGEVQKAYRDDAARFMTTKADFKEAYNHAITARAKQLELAGATPQQASQQVYREELDLAYSAMQQGKSPAETLYKYATDVYGYKPGGKAAAAPPPGSGRDDQGRFVSIEAEQKKAAAATNMSRGGSAMPRNGLLPPEEGVKLQGGTFDKWYEEQKAASMKSAGKKKITWR